MTAPPRPVWIALMVPLAIGVSGALRALPRVRTVDWLLIFVGGLCAGVTLVAVVQLVRESRRP